MDFKVGDIIESRLNFNSKYRVTKIDQSGNIEIAGFVSNRKFSGNINLEWRNLFYLVGENEPEFEF